MPGNSTRDAGIGTRHRHHGLLQNSGRLEIAQQIANHESARTPGLYDRRGDEIFLDEVERIGI